MNNVLKTCVVLSLCVAFTSPVLANGKGGTPNGKPFVEVNGQIVEVKNDITDIRNNYDAIVARIDALELDLASKISALEAEVAALKEADTAILAEMQRIADQATVNGYNIEFAFSELMRLQEEIDALYALSGDQSVAIGELQTAQANLEAELATNAAGLLSALADIRANGTLIDFLSNNISDLQNQLANKQNDIAGSCPAGSFVTAVNDDGHLECAVANAAGEIETRLRERTINIDHYRESYCAERFLGVCFRMAHRLTRGDDGVTAFCPNGYVATGGGYFTNPGDNVSVTSVGPQGTFGWRAYFVNNASGGTSGVTGTARVRCVRIN